MTLLYGVSKFLFTALALSVVISLFASYFVAISVVPLYCGNLLKSIVQHGTPAEEHPGEHAGVPSKGQSWGSRFHAQFNLKFERMLGRYDEWVKKALDHPKEVVWGFVGIFIVSFALYPLVGVSFFPRTDAGQFIINVKAPTGTRLEVTEIT